MTRNSIHVFEWSWQQLAAKSWISTPKKINDSPLCVDVFDYILFTARVEISKY